MGSTALPTFAVQDVAVIGAGPCGLSAAKYLQAQGCFQNIVVYEQSAEVGGVWLYSPEPSHTLHVPQVSPFCPPDPPLRPPDAPPVFPSPMYQLLHTNIPKRLMGFSDLDFSEDSLVFPPRETVQNYLVQYSQDIRHLIRFSTQVKDVTLHVEDGRDRWYVETASTITGETATNVFDAVVVASGHYSTTYIPAIKNIGAFHETHPDVITHSKLYRKPEGDRGKKVVVVGNSASGMDVAAQISPHCSQPLLLSVRTPTPPENLEHIGCEEIPEISEFLIESKGIRLQDGRVEEDIDAIIFSTGYLYSYPFLESVIPPLVTDGRRVYNLWKDLIHIDHPTLAFPGLPIKVVPFPVSESQAAIFSRAWGGSLDLPTRTQMRAWEEEEEKKRGHAFHVYPKGGDLRYINEIRGWLDESGSRGKIPPFWDDELAWQRTIYAAAKLEFEQTGRTAKSLEELGFHYKPVVPDQQARDLL